MAALVLGIASFLMFGPLLAIPAIIFGSIAGKEIKQSGGSLQGQGMASWGLWLGVANLVLTVVVFGILFTMGFGAWNAATGGI